MFVVASISCYLTLRNIVTLKSRSGVTRGNWKCYLDRTHTSSYLLIIAFVDVNKTYLI